MSAPLVVNTAEGTCWTRREATRNGQALYAPEAIRECPEAVMATYAELAEHGIAGEANALPMPVGPEPRTLDMVEDELTGARLSLYEEELETARLRLALKSAQRGRRKLRARVAELEAQRDRRRARLVALQTDALNIRGALSPSGEARRVPMPLGETLLPAVEWLINRVAELEERAKSARVEAIADVGDFLDEHSQKDAAYIVYTVDIPAARAMKRVPLEDPHDSPLHHGYRLGRDLPSVGGVE
ncbi:hypothetical protein SAMN04490357_0978 [Streptomyces misionensis]|uniref:Uncharacterized protein n=1 Tax=Streptomyces misionensis TaxID=67331 RepID=A0A1H4P3C0_9ACTN|nr:hypothetical protein [Streptomyces misionensis]SEC01967.1 hypothetical protein SAMN04490357_0978 [Streptomyces misionensis]